MRSIWKGAITFGLVNVPIKVYSATEDHDTHLHQVHDADGGRIRYQRRCEVCDKVVDYEHIDKAFEEGGTTVVLTEDDLKSLPTERSREIEVVEFVPSDQIDPIMFDRSYFLEPEKSAVKAYALLLKTLEETDRTAIVQFSLRQKTRLGALRSRPSTGSGNGGKGSGNGGKGSGNGGKGSGNGGKGSGNGGKGSGNGSVLMLQSLLWDDEVREADFETLKSDVRVSAQEAEMASSLVDNMSGDFSPDKFGDDYQAQLKELIAAKLEQGDAVDTAATFGEADDDDSGEADVIDLMEALRQSVERNRASRGQSATDGKNTGAKKTGDPKVPARKKPAAKKPAEKKPAARKTAAKKTASTKATSKKSAAKQAS